MLLTGLVVVELAGPRWADLDWTTLPALAMAGWRTARAYLTSSAS